MHSPARIAQTSSEVLRAVMEDDPSVPPAERARIIQQSQVAFLFMIGDPDAESVVDPVYAMDIAASGQLLHCQRDPNGNVLHAELFSPGPADHVAFVDMIKSRPRELQRDRPWHPLPIAQRPLPPLPPLARYAGARPPAVVISDAERSAPDMALYDKMLQWWGYGAVDRFVPLPAAVVEPEGCRTVVGAIRSGVRQGFAQVEFGIKTVMCIGPEAVPCYNCRARFRRQKSLLQLQCGHTLCRPCVRELVLAAVRDESHWPPRCCDVPVAAPMIHAVLRRPEEALFLARLIEYSVPGRLRLYCSNVACRELVLASDGSGASVVGGVARATTVTCGRCAVATCVACRLAAHPEPRQCLQGPYFGSLVDGGLVTGWKRCYRCDKMVELPRRLPNAVCECGAGFCKICCTPWVPVQGCPNWCDVGGVRPGNGRSTAGYTAHDTVAEHAHRPGATLSAQERVEANVRSRQSLWLQSMRGVHQDEAANLQVLYARATWYLVWRTAHAMAQLADDRIDRAGVESKNRGRAAAKVDKWYDEPEVSARVFHWPEGQSLREVTMVARPRHGLFDDTSTSSSSSSGSVFHGGLGAGAGGGTRPITAESSEKILPSLDDQLDTLAGQQHDHEEKSRACMFLLRHDRAECRDAAASRHRHALVANEAEHAQMLACLGRCTRRDEQLLRDGFVRRRAVLERGWARQRESARLQLEGQTGLAHGVIDALDWPTDTSPALAGLQSRWSVCSDEGGADDDDDDDDDEEEEEEEEEDGWQDDDDEDPDDEDRGGVAIGDACERWARPWPSCASPTVNNGVVVQLKPDGSF